MQSVVVISVFNKVTKKYEPVVASLSLADAMLGVNLWKMKSPTEEWDTHNIMVRDNVMVVGSLGEGGSDPQEQKTGSPTKTPKPISKADKRPFKRKSQVTETNINNEDDDDAEHEAYLKEVEAMDDDSDNESSFIDTPEDETKAPKRKNPRVGRYEGKTRGLKKGKREKKEPHPSDLKYVTKKTQGNCPHPKEAKATENGHTVCRQCGINYEDLEDDL